MLCTCEAYHVHVHISAYEDLLSALYVLLCRDHFQSALATDGKLSITALSMAVWNRKMQVIVLQWSMLYYMYMYMYFNVRKAQNIQLCLLKSCTI